MNTSLALTSCTVAVMLIGNLVVMADRSQRETEHQPVANEVANKVTDEVTNTVTNTGTNIVTETEVYKMVCTVDGEGYCKEYSVRRIIKE